MPSVTITHPDSSTDTIPQTVGWERKRKIGNMRRVLIDVERSLAEPIDFELKQDTVELGNIDTLRLVDIQTGSSVHTLVAYSLEWDANRAGYTQGGDLRTGSDQNLINGLIGEVSSWTAGTVDSYTGGLEFVFNHAARHEAIRRIEKNVPGEIQFRDSGTVDYVQRLGSDKTGSVELSASAGTIEDSIRITERGRELDGTHVRVLGAHEGEAQLFANLVPQDDPATYSNRVDYTTSRWSSGDTRDWDRWVNKDVSEQATIEEEAGALADELTSSLVEVETTVSGVDLEVGDSVQVVKPSADLDRSMRVHRITAKAGGRNDTESNSSVVYDLLLSTRTVLRGDEAGTYRDIQRFNTGWQGASVAVNIGPHREALDSGNSISIPVRYPDLAYENTAVLYLEGESYRIDSVGAASGGGTSVTSADNSDLTNIEQSFSSLSTDTLGSGLHTLDSFTVGASPSVSALYGGIFIEDTNNAGISLAEVRLVDTTTGEVYPSDPGPPVNLEDVATVTATAQEDVSGHTFEWQVGGGTGESVTFSWWYQTAGQHTHSVTVPNHTHAPDPGIYTTNDTPSNVDVIVNGTTVASNVGTGSFQTSVDLAGEFNKDAWNTLELTSDSLGILQSSVFLEGYAKVGQT